MPWIFGSFQVTPCALTSCHVVISKQGSTIRALGWNRCVTGRRPRDENHAVRFRQRQRIGDDQRRLWRACKGVQALAPPGSRREEEVLSLIKCLSTHLSQTIETSTLSRIKCERYIFIKKCVRSLKFVNYVWLSFRLYLYLYYGYTTKIASWK